MKSMTIRGFGLLLTVLIAFSAVAIGQEKKGWPPAEIKSSGKAWGVYMKPAKLDSLSDKGVLVAEDDSEEGAKRIANMLFDDPANKFPKDLFQVVGKAGGSTNASDDQAGSIRTLSLDLPGDKKLSVPLTNVNPKQAMEGPAEASVIGSWKGVEGNDNPVEFIFSADGWVTAKDKYGSWSGTWERLTPTQFVFELSSPLKIRYSGKIADGNFAGTARRVDTGATWRWSLNPQSRVSRKPVATKPTGIYQMYFTNDEGRNLVGKYTDLEVAKERVRSDWNVWSKAQERGVNYSNGRITEVGLLGADGRVVFKVP